MRTLAIFAFAIMLSGATAAAMPLTKDGFNTGHSICGGLPDYRCAKDEWCKFPAESRCGIGDVLGTCKPRPEYECPVNVINVCGCDGKTYDSACEAAKQGGVDVAHNGPCRSTVE